MRRVGDTKIRPEDERREVPNIEMPSEAVSQGAPVNVQSNPNPQTSTTQQADIQSSVHSGQQPAEPSAANVPAIGVVRPGVHAAPPAVGEVKQPAQGDDSVAGMFYNVYDRASRENEAASKRRNEILDSIRKAQQEGRDVRTILFERMKPQRDEDKEARMKKMGLATAVGNLLSAIGTGVVATGSKSRGYAPKNTGSKYPHEALAQLNKLEEDYLRQDREYKQMEFQWANAEQERQDKMLYAELAAAERELAGKEQRLGALEELALKSRLSGAQEKEMLRLRGEIAEKQAEIEHKYRMRQIGAQTAGQKEVAMMRNYFDGKEKDEKPLIIYDRDGKTRIRLDSEDIGKYYEAGLKLKVIPADGSKPKGTTEVFHWKNLSDEQKAMYLRQAYIAAKYAGPPAKYIRFDPDNSAEPQAGRSQSNDADEILLSRRLSEQQLNDYYDELIKYLPVQ